VRLRICRDLAADPEAVWDDVRRIDTHVEWMADAVSIAFRTAQRQGVGTEFTCLTRIGPLRTTDVMRVTEWDPPSVLGIEHRGAVRGRGRFTLRAAPGGTRFCWEEELRFPWWMGGPLGAQVARPLLRRVWARNLERLAARFSGR
jgi:hypothetical protein